VVKLRPERGSRQSCTPHDQQIGSERLALIDAVAPGADSIAGAAIWAVSAGSYGSSGPRMDTMSGMTGDEDVIAAARDLAGRAHEVGHIHERWRELLQAVSRRRLGRRRAGSSSYEVNSPWQDTPSPLRSDWRERAANLHGDQVFAVDYFVCGRCRIGWVEEPYTPPQYERCGLAAAGLAQLRDEHPGVVWHTLGGHLSEARAFWASVSADVPGGYTKARLCEHVRP
jgi:hypothetical protein